MTFRLLKIDDHALTEINGMFDWHAAAALPDGRLLGRLTPGKRPNPNPIPDYRIKKLNELVPLDGKAVLEIGCFEGIHTVGLCQFGADVTAIDIRPINIAKTQMRLSLHGAAAKVFLADAETLDASFGRFDVIFHFGVLYHLLKPIEHLAALGRISDAIYLDTHYCHADDVTGDITIGDATYQYRAVDEGGWQNPFSGKDPTAIHLTLRSLETALSAAGFTVQTVLQQRDERNGPRALIWAGRA